MDLHWWNVYGEEVDRTFAGERWALPSGVPGTQLFERGRPLSPNSGAGAIGLASRNGARRVVLLGYDGQKTGGRAHWHADHPEGLGNAGSMGQWAEQFTRIAELLCDVEIVNASRETALQCFARVPLEDALWGAYVSQVTVHGMHGMGDNLHQRSVVRELMREREVWLETPWPSIYHDLVGPRLHLMTKGSRLRTQAKNAQREAALYTKDSPPQGSKAVTVKYPSALVRTHRGVLAAMSNQVGVAVGDFRMPVPADWQHGLDLPTDRPVLALRPLVERNEWGGNKTRNPRVETYTALLDRLRDRFFIVSVADLEPGAEWLAQPDVDADLTLHRGELDFRQLAALWRDAAFVMTSPGFGLVLAQAVGTPVIAVFGGYEAAYSFSAGAALSPTLSIEPETPCDCFSHRHDCPRDIDLPSAIEQLEAFLCEHSSKV